ncbi:MAG: hypothetical protein M3R08_06185, partial [Bacteroidota bacterium]|nr:hypothetical protein [Bacteroidota bacterium]
LKPLYQLLLLADGYNQYSQRSHILDTDQRNWQQGDQLYRSFDVLNLAIIGGQLTGAVPDPTGISGGLDDASVVSRKMVQASDNSRPIIRSISSSAVVSSIGDMNKYMSAQIAHMKHKLGHKVGRNAKNGLPSFSMDKAGVDRAIAMVRSTLENATTETQAFIAKSDKQRVVDIYSDNTGLTVRINADTKDFVTLIEGQTGEVQKTITNAAKAAN